MCGISGIFNLNQAQIDSNILLSMNNALIHRGPDAGNIQSWKHIGLGHRRLSIIDLSISANQPMQLMNDRFSIVYNGEVYNFLTIKAKLIDLGHQFKTNSDTEVVLAAYAEYGEKCFKMFNGMFALAIYDSLNDKLILARDAFGIKPLYFFKNKETFCFASEIKALKKHPNVDLKISKQALSEYLWFGNPLGENTIYNRIMELKPGTYQIIEKKSIRVVEFFSVNEINEIKINEEDAISRIAELLEKSIKRHLISDVPVGVFLSGGIDSSAITAYAAKYYQGTLNTYSVGFDFDKGVNELPLAKKIAEKYGTNHHEIKVGGKDIINVIEKLVEAHGEPFADAADIPLYLLTLKLKGKIKVVLQGDGGDEFFGGYSRYHTLSTKNKWSALSWLSPLIQVSGTKNIRLKRLQRFLTAISEKKPYKRNALLLTMESKYSNPIGVLTDFWKDRVKRYDPFKKYKDVYKKYPKNINSIQALFYTDAQIVLKDAFLEKVDKSTMANSMEIRVPFLDKNLTEFMLSVPADLKVKNGVPKYLLKKSLDGLVPNEVLYGKKKGFGVPYEYWIKTVLKDYFIEQIGTSKAREFIDFKRISLQFKEHLKGIGNHGYILWKVLIFCVWLNKEYTNE